MERIELDVLGNFVGSAYPPQVAISETEDGHRVDVTYDDAEDGITTVGYDVPDWSDEEQARADAETARASAEALRAAAESSRESAERSRTSAEALRAQAESGRESAEAERQSVFDFGEAARQSEFERNEAARQAAEAQRQGAEAARESEFSANETARQAAFDDAEATRASAEESRAQAESGRVSAEAAREAAASEALEDSRAATAGALAAEADATAAAQEARDAAASVDASKQEAQAANDAAQQATADVAAEIARQQAAYAAAEQERDDAFQTAEDEREAYVAGLQSVIDGKAERDAYAPELAAGSADTLAGESVDAATFMRRASGAPRDGVARVKRVLGKTVVWNQLLKFRTTASATKNGLTYAPYINDSKVRISGTWNGLQTSDPNIYGMFGTYNILGGHKYLAFSSDDRYSLYCYWTGGNAGIYRGSYIFTANSSVSMSMTIRPANLNDPYTIDSDVAFCLIDLTLMFGAGNEPSTVAEFEAMFPKSYYPYDAGSLLSVDVRGVESVGFNLWDEEWELGGIDSTTGANTANNIQIRSKNYIPVFPATDYYFCCGSILTGSNPSLRFYDADKGYIGAYPASGNISPYNMVFTTPANAHYMRFAHQPNYGTTYNHDTCINLSDPARNGDYEPYRADTAAFDTSTYFPDGMKSAGSVSDELTNSKAVTLIGAVDLGTLSWTYITTSSGHWRFYATLANVTTHYQNLLMVPYIPISPSTQYTGVQGISCQPSGNNTLIMISDESYSTSTDFKAAMSGVMLYYELATPTVTEIDPPLNLTYRTEAGGTERAIVDETATAPQSAPPTWGVAYGYTAESLRDEALAVIAPIENYRASTNYAVGSYLIHGGKLCKVSTAIAAGELVVPGTNVAETTVMAEIAAIA